MTVVQQFQKARSPTRPYAITIMDYERTYDQEIISNAATNEIFYIKKFRDIFVKVRRKTMINQIRTVGNFVKK